MSEAEARDARSVDTPLGEAPSSETAADDAAVAATNAEGDATTSHVDGATSTGHDGAGITSTHADGVRTAARQGGVHTIDLPGQERIVRGRMPALEVVNERFARGVTAALTQWLQRELRPSGASLSLQRCAAFTAALPAASSLEVVALDPLRGQSLLVIEPALVFMMIEALFGGQGKLDATLDGREFSPTESRVIDRLVALACEAWGNAWQGIVALKPKPQRRETQPRRAQVAQPPDTVVASRFEFTLGERRAAMHLCVPYASLEPIRETLYAAVAADPAAGDSRWMRQLAQQLQRADVTLAARLATTRVTVSQLLAMEPGDLIELELSPHALASVEGVPIFEGAYGVANGRYALRVDRMLAGAGAQQEG